MKKDIRGTALYEEASALYQAIRQPGSGLVCEAVEAHVAPSARHAVFTGTIDEREGSAATRVCEIDLTSGAVRVLSEGPHTDRSPKYSPDGRTIAFLSDAHAQGDFQVYLLDVSSGTTSRGTSVPGWVEYLHWSPDGKRLLLGVAGHGADVAGGQGAVASRQVVEHAPSWMPELSTGAEEYRWRHAWLYEVASGRVHQVSPTQTNIWEAAWCGDEAIAAVVSDDPEEGAWYSAQLQLIDVATGLGRVIYMPRDQLGWLAASPEGSCLAVVEAVCSDRGIVAGDVRLIDTASSNIQQIDACGVDITYLEWRSERRLLMAGHRGFETVVGIYDRPSAAFTEIWSSEEVSSTARYIAVSGLNESGDCIVLGEGFTRAPEVGVLRDGVYSTVKSFDLGYGEHARTIAAVDRVRWTAQDGLEIQGWLLRPPGTAPYPTVMVVHGGPISLWHSMWLGRPRTLPILMLLRRGYAILLPNPRGSSGRGQEFARSVLGDVGGADAKDCLGGLDHLIANGVAAADKLGVTGVSYGGFMTCWLITQDQRFAAAVAVAPITNYVTEQLLSNIPDFAPLFLADVYTNAGGRFSQRSPIMHVGSVRTPVLNICGALDRCTPPQEAMQFHNALRRQGVKSVLVTYPQEGHGVRKFPATLDYAARLVSWFEEHIMATQTRA